MASVLVAYGTSTALTITLTSLASSATAGRESTAVDNSSNLYLDALCQVTCKLATGTPANDKAIYIYAYGSENGTVYTDNATGSDAAITLRDPTNLRLVAVIPVPDSGALTYESSPFSIAQAFGGVMPRKWGLVVRNYTGVALDSSGNAATYTGISATVA
jgi:hypothetical protein